MAMLTEAEDVMAGALAARHAGENCIAEAMKVVDNYLKPTDGLRRIRLREHPLCPADADPDWLATELSRMSPPR